MVGGEAEELPHWALSAAKTDPLIEMALISALGVYSPRDLRAAGRDFSHPFRHARSSSTQGMYPHFNSSQSSLKIAIQSALITGAGSYALDLSYVCLRIFILQ